MSKGSIAEKKAVGEASKNIVIDRLKLLGLDVYRPVVDNKQIDAVMRIPTEYHVNYYDIKIKSVKAYNTVINVKNLHEKKDNYILIIYYRHDDNRDEFYYLKLDQALELWTGPDGEWKEVYFQKPQREKFKHQTLEHLAAELLGS